MDYRDEAVKALEAQAFKAAGPKLITRVADALATDDEGMPGGERTHKFDYVEVLEDTPEPRDRLPGVQDPRTEVSYALAEVLNAATADQTRPDS